MFELIEWFVKICVLMIWLEIVLVALMIWLLIALVAACTGRRVPRFPRGLRRAPIRL